MVFIILRSITYAQRAKDRLAKQGISSSITRVPLTLGKNGCGYALKIDEAQLQEALACIKLGNIPITRVYRMVGERYEEISI